MITVTIETENLSPEDEQEFARFCTGMETEEEAFYYDYEGENKIPRHFIKNVKVKVT